MSDATQGQPSGAETPRVAAPEIPGIDPARVTRVDEGWFPHLIVDVSPYRLSILGVVDFDHPDFPHKQPWPLVAGVVEIGLLGESGLIADPLEHVSLAEAAAICAGVARGELGDFDVENYGR
jgi:hypothetical protein